MSSSSIPKLSDILNSIIDRIDRIDKKIDYIIECLDSDEQQSQSSPSVSDFRGDEDDPFVDLSTLREAAVAVEAKEASSDVAMADGQSSQLRPEKLTPCPAVSVRAMPPTTALFVPTMMGGRVVQSAPFSYFHKAVMEPPVMPVSGDQQ